MKVNRSLRNELGTWTATDAADYILEHLSGEARAQVGEESPRWFDPLARANEPLESSPQATSVRAALARSIDTYGSLLLGVFGAFASEASQVISAQGTGDQQPAPVGMVAAPGSVAGAIVWIHNTSGDLVPEFTLRMTDLTRPDGTRLSADDGAIVPTRFELSLAVRRSAWVSMAVPTDARLGTYYGHLLADGLLDAAVPVRLEVR